VLAILVVVGFTVASVGYSLLQPTVHGAQTEFILTPRPTLSDVMVDRAMVTQTMILTSDSVLGPVAAQTGIPVNRLRDRVSADIVGRSDVLRVTVGDRSQARALQLVQLIGAQYLEATNTAAPPATDTPTKDDGPPITLSILTPASPLDRPLQPQPLRALAAGLLLGLLAAAAAATVVVRPRLLASPSPHWT
jgi:capsular polysaccharide biosynthesis protein